MANAQRPKASKQRGERREKEKVAWCGAAWIMAPWQVCIRHEQRKRGRAVARTFNAVFSLLQLPQAITTNRAATTVTTTTVTTTTIMSSQLFAALSTPNSLRPFWLLDSWFIVYDMEFN